MIYQTTVFPVIGSIYNFLVFFFSLTSYKSGFAIIKRNYQFYRYIDQIINAIQNSF